jgi:hypothetical protein
VFIGLHYNRDVFIQFFFPTNMDETVSALYCKNQLDI